MSLTSRSKEEEANAGITLSHLAIFLLCASLVVSGVVNFPKNHLDRPIGDLVIYWTTCRLALASLPLVNPDLLFTIASQFEPTFPGPDIMPNPPYLLTLLFPILILPYDLSKFAFDFVALFTLLICSFMSVRTGAAFSLKSIVKILFAVSVFTPFIHAWGWRQSSFLLLLAMVLLLNALKSRKGGMALGIAAVLGCIKPHLFIFPLLFVAIYLIRQQRSKEVAKAICIFILLLGCQELLFPTTLQQWWNYIGAPLEGSLNLLRRRPASLIYPLQELVFWLHLQGIQISTKDINHIVGLLWMFGIGLAFFLSTTMQGSVSIKLLVGTAVSLLFVPYGWASDMIILIPLYLIVLSPWLLGVNQSLSRQYIVLATMSVTTILSAQVTYAHSLFYIVPVLLACYLVAGPRLDESGLRVGRN